MGLFRSEKKCTNSRNETIIKEQRKRIKQLENLCKEKDSYFVELISDGLRHGSSMAAKYMIDRKEYLKGK